MGSAVGVIESAAPEGFLIELDNLVFIVSVDHSAETTVAEGKSLDPLFSGGRINKFHTG